MVPDLLATRRRRFGRERLEVRTIHGDLVGTVDLRTGKRSIEMPEFSAAFERAVARALPEPTTTTDDDGGSRGS